MTTAEKKAVCYYRVSTEIQETSGLGLESQESIVRKFCVNGGYTIIKEFTEIESGGKVDRKILNEALKEVKSVNGILLVAKLDRLTRDLAHLLAIRKSGVKFIAVDQPDSDNFMINIYGVVAEKEREMISQRMKDVSAAKKARGEHIGRKVGSIRINQDEINKNLKKKSLEKYMKSIEGLRGLLIECKGLNIIDVTKKVEESGYRTSRGSIATSATIKKYIKDLKINWDEEDINREAEYTRTEMVNILRQKFGNDDLKKIFVELKL